MPGAGFSEVLVSAVRASGIAQQHLSAQIGVSGALLSNWLHGRTVNEAQIETVRALARLVGIPFEAALTSPVVPQAERVAIDVCRCRCWMTWSFSRSSVG